jgi:hypothetical protein
MFHARTSAVLVGLGIGIIGCAGERPPSTAESVTGIAVAPAQTIAARRADPSGVPSPASPKLSPPIEVQAVASATGVEKPEASDGVVKVSFPRSDVPVVVDGSKLPPFMGLTSWVAFGPARESVAETMIMGDLVLFEDEVSSVMSVLLDGGAQVTALHNHFFFDQPRVYFMHVGGEGTVAALGKTVKQAMDRIAEIRKKTPKPAASFGVGPIPSPSTLDAVKLENVLGVKGTAKDGMFKIVVGRDVKAACGCPAGKAMGVTTWAAFAGSEVDAVVDGDFAIAEDELQPVLKELRAGGIHVVAIHHHMSGETPRLLFAHYWGRGKAADLAAVVKRTLDKSAR